MDDHTRRCPQLPPSAPRRRSSVLSRRRARRKLPWVASTVTEQLEIVFETIVGSRKMQNLRRDPRIALVVSDADEMVQIEGVADEPTGEELNRLKTFYTQAHRTPNPESWKDSRPGDDAKDRTFTCVRVKPTWARYSDFRKGGVVAEVIKRWIDPVVFSDLCDDLVPLVERELAAGNNVAETYRGYPAKGVNVWLGLPFRAEHTELPGARRLQQRERSTLLACRVRLHQARPRPRVPVPRTPGGDMTRPIPRSSDASD